MNRVLLILFTVLSFAAKGQIVLSYDHRNIHVAHDLYSHRTGLLDTARNNKADMSTQWYADSVANYYANLYASLKVDSVKKSNDTFYYYKGGVKYFAGKDNTGSAGAVNWGDIGGTLSDQTDLQNALDAKKANSDSTGVHGYVPQYQLDTTRSDVWAALYGKQASLGYTPKRETDSTLTDPTDYVTQYQRDTMSISIWNALNGKQAAGSYLTSSSIEDAINDGTTNKAPSENAVYDALALKQNSLGFTAVPTTRAINTTSPISGGGDLSADRTISIANAAADGATKGAASFNASDFDATAGNISIDYTNGQAASASTKGFLPSADFTHFQAGYDDKINSASYSAGQLTLTQQDAGTVTATINDATTATKGIASYSSTFFSVASGVVSVKSGGIGSTEIADGSVALGDMANMATASLLGRNTAGTGAPEVLSASTAKTLLSLNNVDNTSDATKNSATATLTNKRITPRVGTTASSSTPTPDADANDIYTVTALAAGATFGAPTGTPVNGQTLLIRIKDNGTARTLAWNAIYRAGTDFALPTTTVISKTMYVQFIYNSADSKWDCIGSTNGF